MKRANQDCPDRPTIPDAKVRELRARLILEEALETVIALGFHLSHDSTGLIDPKLTHCRLKELTPPDLVQIIDGCCDIKVVTTGTLLACGVPHEIFQIEVDYNNLAKFGPGHSYREDGKLIKPPGHQPPAIACILGRI